MTDSPPSLGELIREALARNNMTQNALAQAIGYSEGTIRNLLKAKPRETSVNPDVLRKIAHLLNLNEIEVFQKAGYLSNNSNQANMSGKGRLLAYHYDRLPPHLQNILWDVVTSLEKHLLPQTIASSSEEPDELTASKDNN